MNDIKKMLDDCAAEVTAEIAKYLSRDDADFQVLIDSMRYSALSEGKRIRPFLVLAFAEGLGGSKEKAMPYACAIEMMHSYSLIHDDLPAMDNDDLRRGVPTNHKVFGESSAILAGDALFTSAIEAAADNKKLSAENRIAAIQLLSTSAGAYGMVGGQQMDLATKKGISFDKLIRMHSLKTGALIKCAGLLGVLAAGRYSDEKIRNACTNYCINVGLAFQIIDDIMDVTESPEVTGKSTSDARNSKVTFLSYMTPEGAYDCASKLTEKACEAVADFDKNRVLADLAKFLLNRKK